MAVPMAPLGDMQGRRSRDELVEIADRYRAMSNEWLRRQIVDNNRIDILIVGLLGYELQPFHMRMLQWQFQHPDSLILCYRGSGKSTVCTVGKAIHLIVKDRSLRIMLASKTVGNSENFLAEIKSHLEGNDRLIEVFGRFYNPRLVRKWDMQEIEVLGRERTAREATITCVGVDTAVTSKHVDVIISDDLFDDQTSRTKLQRERLKIWYYQTLDPCLEPPDKAVPHRGEHHRLATRYHPDDLAGHLIENELKDDTLVIPGIDKLGRSVWPAKHPAEWFAKKRKRSGIIIFRAQYLLDTEAMRGEVFQIDIMPEVSDTEIPWDELQIFQGVDLAISEKHRKRNDRWAHVTIGMDKVGNYYVLTAYADRLRFSVQTKRIVKLWRRHKPMRVGIETQAYQEAQYQTLRELHPEMVMKPIKRGKGAGKTDDKDTRAWGLAAIMEEGRMFFRKGLVDLIDELVQYPNADHDDYMDALDLAVQASRFRERRRRRAEPGVI